MKHKYTSISGVTLLEMLIGIVISAIMMAALYTSYTAVNTSYSQVADRETISRTGRDAIGMLLKDIRMAGYFDVDSVKVAHTQMYPLRIDKSKSFTGTNRKCDNIVIVHGDTIYNKGKTPEFTYPIYKIMYQCMKSKIPNRKGKKSAAGTYPTKDLFGLYKKKVSWNRINKTWNDPNSDSDSKTYDFELVIDHVEDLIVNPIDEKGLIISPLNENKMYDIRSVDVLLMLRSADSFFKTNKQRYAAGLSDPKRFKNTKDKYLRDSIIVTAHTRNIGLGK